MTRECLTAVPDTSISERPVVRELTELITKCGPACKRDPVSGVIGVQ